MRLASAWFAGELMGKGDGAVATVPGGLFDSSSNTNVDASQGAAISSFLDSLGISETQITQVTVSTTGTNTISDTAPVATFSVGTGQTVNVVLSGSAGKTLIVTGSGNASIAGGAGGDSVLGGSGSDSITGGLGDDQVRGGAGNDIVYGGEGNDVLYGNFGDDSIGSDQGDDVFYGGIGNDTVRGGGDNDRLFGNRDADVLYGNQANDVLYGNQQNDVLYGGQGNDVLFGGQNDDALWGNAGADTLYGGQGGDVFSFRSGDGTDVIQDFVTGTDIIRIASNINGLSVSSATDFLTRISSDASGNAVIDLGGGNQVTVVGLTATNLQTNISSIIQVF